jgi:hypothetical protein
VLTASVRWWPSTPWPYGKPNSGSMTGLRCLRTGWSGKTALMWSLPAVPVTGPSSKILSMMTAPAANLAGRTSLKMLAALYQGGAAGDHRYGAHAPGSSSRHARGGSVRPHGPVAHGPFGDGHQVIRTAPACSPCFKRQCDEHRCRCMTDITVDLVLSAIHLVGNRVADRSRINEHVDNNNHL